MSNADNFSDSLHRCPTKHSKVSKQSATKQFSVECG